jgi:hypothetical protein
MHDRSPPTKLAALRREKKREKRKRRERGKKKPQVALKFCDSINIVYGLCGKIL